MTRSDKNRLCAGVIVFSLVAVPVIPAAAQLKGLGGALRKIEELKRQATAQGGPAMPRSGGSEAPSAAGAAMIGPASTHAPTNARARVIGPYRTGSVNDLIGWNGKLYIARASDGGIMEVDPSGKSRLITHKGWKTDSFYDNGVYELAAGPEGMFALRGKSLFRVDASGVTTPLSDGWGYVKGMAVLGGRIYVIDDEDFYVRDPAPGSQARKLANDWHNCKDLEAVGGKLVALCQDRLWVVQADGSRKQLGQRAYSDPMGIADVGGQIYLAGNTNHGQETAASERHEASIYRVDWNGVATKLAPLPAAWNVRKHPLGVAGLNGALYVPREHDGGYSDDREIVAVTL